MQGQCTETDNFFQEDPQGKAQHSEVYNWLSEPVKVDMCKTHSEMQYLVCTVMFFHCW